MTGNVINFPENSNKIRLVKNTTVGENNILDFPTKNWEGETFKMGDKCIIKDFSQSEIVLLDLPQGVSLPNLDKRKREIEAESLSFFLLDNITKMKVVDFKYKKNAGGENTTFVRVFPADLSNEFFTAIEVPIYHLKKC